jgi:Na+/H+ antiporter NhaD/arsenite permease-like protein
MLEGGVMGVSPWVMMDAPPDAATTMPLWSVLPFTGLLLSIAIIPLLAHDWWHQNRNKALVSVLFGIPTAIFVAFRDSAAVAHAALEYVAFISLLGSLYVISGGVLLRGSLPGTPASNAALLSFGALLANLTGTTGAAMLLLRPFLHANRSRKRKVHLVVFFILIVANSGGILTPIGDPPLFLGFLKGVPFFWTLTLWKEWLLVCGTLVAVFYVFDRLRHRKEGAPVNPKEPLGFEGFTNLALLAGVIGVILAGGFWIQPVYGESAAQLVQSALLLGLAGASLALTPRARRIANEFSWHPLVEVAVLFVGIFAAMIPLSPCSARTARRSVSCRPRPTFGRRDSSPPLSTMPPPTSPSCPPHNTFPTRSRARLTRSSRPSLAAPSFSAG